MLSFLWLFDGQPISPRAVVALRYGTVIAPRDKIEARNKHGHQRDEMRSEFVKKEQGFLCFCCQKCSRNDGRGPKMQEEFTTEQ